MLPANPCEPPTAQCSVGPVPLCLQEPPEKLDRMRKVAERVCVEVGVGQMKADLHLLVGLLAELVAPLGELVGPLVDQSVVLLADLLVARLVVPLAVLLVVLPAVPLAVPLAVLLAVPLAVPLVVLLAVPLAVPLAVLLAGLECDVVFDEG